jgi:hypothetical protein
MCVDALDHTLARADNLFHPLTYGDIDVDAIEDPLLRAAARQQILDFGQVCEGEFRIWKLMSGATGAAAAVSARAPDAVADDALVEAVVLDAAGEQRG